MGMHHRAAFVLLALGFLAGLGGAASFAAPLAVPAAVPVAPVGASERSRRVDQAVQAVLHEHRASLEKASVGVQVRSVSRQETLFTKDAGDSFIPASNQKLVTLAYALETLGAEYVFETPLIADGRIDEAHGVLDGDLWIQGSGDPTLHHDFFASDNPDVPLSVFVDAVRTLGIERITGDLVLDDRRFANEGLPERWPAMDLDRDYCAPSGALSLNANCIQILVRGQPRSPAVEMRPRAVGYEIDSRLETSRDDPSELDLRLSRPDEKSRIHVNGTMGARAGMSRWCVPVRDATHFFGQALMAALEDSGVAVQGTVRGSGADERPAAPRTLFTRRGAMLPAVYVCGKESDNFIAEQLFKATTAKRAGVGSYVLGGGACLDFLRELSVDTSGFVVADGSGLSRDDRVTPQGMVQLLEAMYRSTRRDPYLRALPISGIDGTLDDRMVEDEYRCRVRAKTGYLSGVSCLSGYLYAGGDARGGDHVEAGEVCAFSILVNGFRSDPRRIKAFQDDVCRAVLDALR